MEAKTRNLILTLEILALATAGILILIDFKLKKDLLALFIRIEEKIAHGEQTLADTSRVATADSVHSGSMVADTSRMEAPNVDDSSSANGSRPTAASNRPRAKRSTGTRSAPVSESDKSVGP